MNEIFDKEVNAQKECLKKYFCDSRKLPQTHEKVCDENETKKQRKKRHVRKNVFGGRKPFIRRTQRTGENDLDKVRVNGLDKLRVNNSGHNEGTICLVNR